MYVFIYTLFLFSYISSSISLFLYSMRCLIGNSIPWLCHESNWTKEATRLFFLFPFYLAMRYFEWSFPISPRLELFGLCRPTSKVSSWEEKKRERAELRRFFNVFSLFSSTTSYLLFFFYLHKLCTLLNWEKRNSRNPVKTPFVSPCFGRRRQGET